MSFKKNEIETKFSDKFHFQKVTGTGRNPHDRWAFFYGDKKIASTGFSRGLRDNDDVVDDLLLLMAREIRVQTLHNFKGMITCSVSAERYIEILKEQGFIPKTEKASD